MTAYGYKLRDGLRAYVLRAAGDPRFVDEILVSMGHHPNVAEDIIDRLDRKGLIEFGVSARSGWLTMRGWDAAKREL